jgi:cytochrome c biogenesis protein CcmG/thiol:disulfide interchange protein DsbE
MWLSAACGIVASACAIGLAVVTNAGADLFRVCAYVAGAFLIAGLARPRPLVLAIAGVVPVIALAVAGIAFASAIWLAGFAVSACSFAAVGAAARKRRGARGAALVVAASAVFVVGGRPLVGRIVEATAIERTLGSIATFRIADADGREVTSAQLRGRVVVLAFWATWCAPCRAELPELVALARRYRGDAHVALYWINTGDGGDTPGLARRYAAEHAPDLATLLAFDRDRIAVELAPGLPAIVVFDRDGKLRVRHAGFDDAESLADAIAREIDRLVERS